MLFSYVLVSTTTVISSEDDDDDEEDAGRHGQDAGREAGGGASLVFLGATPEV